MLALIFFRSVVFLISLIERMPIIHQKVEDPRGGPKLRVVQGGKR